LKMCRPLAEQIRNCVEKRWLPMYHVVSHSVMYHDSMRFHVGCYNIEFVFSFTDLLISSLEQNQGSGKLLQHVIQTSGWLGWTVRSRKRRSPPGSKTRWRSWPVLK
jgi:hypothetical protein